MSASPNSAGIGGLDGDTLPVETTVLPDDPRALKALVRGLIGELIGELELRDAGCAASHHYRTGAANPPSAAPDRGAAPRLTGA